MLLVCDVVVLVCVVSLNVFVRLVRGVLCDVVCVVCVCVWLFRLRFVCCVCNLLRCCMVCDLFVRFVRLCG